LPGQNTARLIVTRYRPGQDRSPTTQTYTVPFQEDWVVLDALNHIKDQMDGTLSYRWSCRMGVCGSCGMMVNGVPKLTCAAFLRDYYPQEIRVEPLVNFPVIRDLVIDMSDFMDKLKSVQPWIIRKEEKNPSEGEYLQSPEELEAYTQFTQCINCMLCYAACPVYGLEPEFLGRRLDRRSLGKPPCIPPQKYIAICRGGYLSRLGANRFPDRESPGYNGIRGRWPPAPETLVPVRTQGTPRSRAYS